MTGNKVILIVDDEVLNLKILKSDLEFEGYKTIQAENGIQALEMLEANFENISAILLDRMMPEMDGMEALAKIKSEERFKDIPIIMQTAAGSTSQIKEGLDMGAFYYLLKPFESEIMLSIVKSAINDRQLKEDLNQELKASHLTMGSLEHCLFRFRTFEEVRSISSVLASCFPDPETVSLGLFEFMANAVEHGNLGITYDEKSQLISNDNWENEINRRLADSEYKDKTATIELIRTDKQIIVKIEDQGKGFDWSKYLEISVERASDSHGRGIAVSGGISFDKIEYQGNGNKVVCIVDL